MGNTNYQDSDLKIYIQTQKPFANSGSTIQGTVFVEAGKNFAFDALYLRIQGDQWCQWFEGSSKNRHKYTGNQNFYCVEHLLERYPNTVLAAGKYAYPYSVELSQNIPGSFQSSKYDAKIEYKLIAYFANYQNHDKRQLQSIPLAIRQPFRQDLVPYVGEATTQPSSCCFSAGTVSLKVHFQKNVCFEGDAVKIQMQADNTMGKKDISHFLIQFVQYTFVSANNGVSRIYKNQLDSIKVEKNIPKGRKDRMEYRLVIPIVKHQSAISTLVANYYRLQVSTINGYCSRDNPSIYAPIFVLKKAFELPPQKIKVNKNAQFMTNKPVVFRAPEFWFKKNRQLDVMNFRLQDALHSNQELRPL